MKKIRFPSTRELRRPESRKEGAEGEAQLWCAVSDEQGEFRVDCSGSDFLSIVKSQGTALNIRQADRLGRGEEGTGKMRRKDLANQGVGVVEARLDVAMEDEDELHVHFGSELGEESIERRQSTLKLIDHHLLEADSSEDSASHNTDLVDDHQPTLKPPERSNTYELEVELRRLKEQNRQAMGALEEATRQIHSLEGKLRGVEIEPSEM
ncbi:hypothetical protein NMY22_g3335 [Coprinellus aureogranulatus]|nr:hypothetical protein NMY22_g3335 [Coprinellus aureogranulatus]